MSKPTKRTKAASKAVASPKPTPPPVQPPRQPLTAPAAVPATTAAQASPSATPSIPVTMLANAPEKKTPASATQTAVVQVPKSPAGPRPGSVHLEIVLPQATQVSVAGSFNDWTPEKNPLKPAGQNRWVADLNIQPGRHEYLFVADGQWLPDPNARETVANPFGGSNSVLTVN